MHNRPNKAKPLQVRDYKQNIIKHENNPGELEAVIDIPLKTVSPDCRMGETLIIN